MSGYASKREAMEVLKHTITTGWNSKAPSTRVEDYFMEKLFRESFYERGYRMGWGHLNPEGEYEEIMAECLRPKAIVRLRGEALEAQARAYDMKQGIVPLPEGLTKRDAADLYDAARDRVDLLKRAMG